MPTAPWACCPMVPRTPWAELPRRWGRARTCPPRAGAPRQGAQQQEGDRDTTTGEGGPDRSVIGVKVHAAHQGEHDEHAGEGESRPRHAEAGPGAAEVPCHQDPQCRVGEEGAQPVVGPGAQDAQEVREMVVPLQHRPVHRGAQTLVEHRGDQRAGSADCQEGPRGQWQQQRQAQRRDGQRPEDHVDLGAEGLECEPDGPEHGCAGDHPDRTVEPAVASEGEVGAHRHDGHEQRRGQELRHDQDATGATCRGEVRDEHGQHRKAPGGVETGGAPRGRGGGATRGGRGAVVEGHGSSGA